MLRALHHECEQRYLIWYENEFRGQFSSASSATPKIAERQAKLFRDDGYLARVLRLAVRDGRPVAEWVQASA